MSIVEFLGARLAEDEAGARLASHPPRLLAECAAKRDVIAAHPMAIGMEWTDPHEIDVCGTCGDGSSVVYPCPTIRAVAAAYSDHGAYRQGWAV